MVSGNIAENSKFLIKRPNLDIYFFTKIHVFQFFRVYKIIKVDMTFHMTWKYPPPPPHFYVSLQYSIEQQIYLIKVGYC